MKKTFYYYHYNPDDRWETGHWSVNCQPAKQDGIEPWRLCDCDTEEQAFEKVESINRRIRGIN